MSWNVLKLAIAVAAVALSATPAVSLGDDAKPSLAEKLQESAVKNRYRLDFDGEAFSGEAYDKLLAEARAAQFFLIGEEHGIAENPKLAAQLFTELSKDGYSRLTIEISAPMATALDETLRKGGLAALKDLFALRGGEPAFFGMKEEAELLAAARATSPRKAPVVWGVDYEVAGDQHLLRLLAPMKKPPAAVRALEEVQRAADAAHAKYVESGDPQYLFSFAGDPALIRAVKDAWPSRTADAAWMLDTLEETLAINKHWVDGEGWASNRRRAAFMRANFLRHWRRAEGREKPRVMVKLGSSHLVRGRNMTETFDLGTLLPELAEIENGHAFSVLVIPGPGSMTAVLNPVTWSYAPAPGKDSYARGLEALTDARFEDAFTLIDLRPIRPLIGSAAAREHPDLARIVHGFDMMLVFAGGTASAEFDHPLPENGG